MNKSHYYGPFKLHIQEFIELKQSLGYKYLSEAKHLKRFDAFTMENYSSSKYLTKVIVMDWCTKKSYEKQENLCSRASIIRQFGKFLDNIGVDTYILPKNYFKSGEPYVPHIYTEDELKRFFHETDKCKYSSQSPYRHLSMPVLFRIIYTCGLRISEARLLKVEDVDLANGILTINNSKKDNSRLVAMTDEITERCREFSKQVHLHSSGENYYFPMIENKPMTLGNIYKNFRKFLWNAAISHGGRGLGPRIHDFRHSFAVHCLKKWSTHGKDLMVYLPILRVYLGHDSFVETAYYLRLTADVFPEITLKLETVYSDLIPELAGDPTNFAKHLTDFFTNYLSGRKNASKNTILAYRDTFKLLLKYSQDIRGISIEHISMDTLSAELIIDFLNWLESERKCSVSTRNQRLASIHSFFRFVQGEEPSGIYHFQKVISIPVKKSEKPVVGHLSPEAVKLILQQPNKYTAKGRRDLTLLSVLYDTGARVQELIDIKICDVFLESPEVIVLTGKGNKVRRVPLMKNTVALLQSYLKENDLSKQWKNQYPLFVNNQHNKLTKEGVAYILNKYVTMAKPLSRSIPEHISPHMFRHSKAMHLLQAGVNLIYIRDFLGHVDIKTTEVYARADTEMKRKAIENVYPDIIDSNIPDWSKDKELLSWLAEMK